MTKKTTTKKIQQLVQSVEPSNLYLSASLLNKKTGSAILVAEDQILARFNNQQVIRPLEAKAYAILAATYGLVEKKIPHATLGTDNYDCGRRFIKLRQRPIATGYQLEREFYYSQRSKIAGPYYLGMARKLISEHNLDLTIDYLPTNPATLISQSLKVCAKCQQLKKIEPRKRNCYACGKTSQQVKYERGQEGQKSQLIKNDHD